MFGADLFEDCFGELSFGFEQELAGIYDVRIREQTMKIIEIEREEVCMILSSWVFIRVFPTQITSLQPNTTYTLHTTLSQSLSHSLTYSHTTEFGS